MIRAAVIALLPLAATAQDTGFAPDYAALFETHADSIMQATPGTRRLELPGPVVVEQIRNGADISYFAIDQSGQGAVGCTFRIMAELVVYGAQCPHTLTDDHKAQLERMLRRTAAFMAANTYPPLPPAEAEPRLRAELRALGTARSGTYTCEAEEAHDMTLYVERLTRPAAEAELDASLSIPRLPVTNPCQ